MKNFLCAVAVLLATGAVAGEAKFVTNLKAGQPQTIVTYGTSLTAGGAWVGQVKDALAKKFGTLPTVINSGASGKWSVWAEGQLDRLVLARKPDTVFIEFAINDAFAKYTTSVVQARGSLERMMDRITAQNPNCEIILMTMNPPIAEHLERRPGIEQYYEMYRDVAKQRKLLLIDHEPNWNKVLKKGEPAFRKLVPDGIHPNAAGCTEIITPEILRATGLGR